MMCLRNRRQENPGEPGCGTDDHLTNPFRYTGREWDAETGLYYYRARYYDPQIGGFISEDPLGFGAGVNFHAYVVNNPTNFVDPSGLAYSPAQCKALLKQIKAMSMALAKELAKYNPVTDGIGGSTMKWGSGRTKPGGHYEEMTGYASGIMNRAADYWKNCKKCDGNPSLPEWIWQSVKDYNTAPRPFIPRVELPDELVNWYDPSPWERFNKFMNQNFGNAPAQGARPVLPPIPSWAWGPA